MPFIEHVTWRRPWVALLVLVLGACTWGTRAATLPIANGPEGAWVAVRVQGESVDRVGELIAVDSIGILVLGTQLQRIAWARVRAVDAKGLGPPYDVLPGSAVDAPGRAHLALVSRFPRGLDAALLARVLSSLGQAELLEVTAAPTGRGGSP